MSQPSGWAAPEPDRAEQSTAGRQAPGDAWGHSDPPPGAWGQPLGPWGQPPAAWGPPPSGTAPWIPAQPRPGIIPLRPLGLGDIFDGAFQAIRTNPRTMIGVSALVIAVTTLVTTVPQAAALTDIGSSALFDPNRADSLSRTDIATTLGSFVTTLVLPAILESLAVTIVTGLLIIAVSGAVLGRKTPPGELWTRTRRRDPGLVGLAVIVPLFGALAAAMLLAPGVIILLAGGTLAGVLLLVLGLLVAVLGYVALGFGYLALAAPAMLLENLSVASALRRSFRLVRGSFWRVFGILLLTAVLVRILSGLVSLPFAAGGTVIGMSQAAPYQNFAVTLLQLAVTNLGTIAAGAVLYPFSAAVSALLYIDLRIRREGLDVELMRSVRSN